MFKYALRTGCGFRRLNTSFFEELEKAAKSTVKVVKISKKYGTLEQEGSGNLVLSVWKRQACRMKMALPQKVDMNVLGMLGPTPERGIMGYAINLNLLLFSSDHRK
jgi:hypothetical protein